MAVRPPKARTLLLGSVLAIVALGSSFRSPRADSRRLEPRAETTTTAKEVPRQNTPEQRKMEKALALPQLDLRDFVSPRLLSGRDDAYPLRPARKRMRMPRRCRTQGGYRKFCQGERIIAEPNKVEAIRAKRLALGSRAMIRHFLHKGAHDAWIAAASEAEHSDDLLFPVLGGRLGRGYGYVRKGRLRHRKHKGIDIGGPQGAVVRAARGGLVVYADNSITGYGNTAVVLHADGSNALYAHCKELSVAAGAYVERGEKIGVIGKTGFAAGTHLHFEFRKKTYPINPRRMLRHK